MADIPFWKQSPLTGEDAGEDRAASPSKELLAEAEAEATRLFEDTLRLRPRLPASAVDQLAAALHSSGTAETMIARVAERLGEGLNLAFPDEDETLTPDQRAALAERARRLFIADIPAIVRDVIEHEEGQPEGFWHRFARDILAMAVLDARNDPDYPLETVEAIDDDTVRTIVDTEPYVVDARSYFIPIGTEAMYRLVRAKMAEASQHEDGDQLVRASMQETLAAARRSLGFPEAPADGPPPVVKAAFDDKGYGFTDTSLISIGARHMLSAPPARWGTDETGFPVFLHENGAGKALYSPSRSGNATVSDALRAVAGYGPSHVATLRYITAMHLANSAAKTSGPYGGFYISVEDILEARGIKKHAKGGFRPEDRREVVEFVESLARIEVTGSIEGYEKGKRGKKSKLTIRSPLIVISHRVTQPGMLAGEERVVAWYLRAGDWAAELERFGPQYARMTKALLQLNPQNDMHAFNLGNYLIEQYRIRAHQRSWKQPYRVATLLEGAEIEIDRKNPARFRKRIEENLNVLCNPVDMHGTPIIALWGYVDVVEAKGRGWFDRWLDAGIVIIPREELIGPYRNMRALPGRRRKGTPPA